MFDEIKFRRESLYGEVWQDPMPAVASRHRISVEALRKICKNFAIPLPPLGYWAKVRAGKRVKRPPLRGFDGPTVITRQVRVDPEEAARREEAARTRRERWSASIRAQVEARERRLRDQAEFFGEADKWIELQHRLQYLDHIERSARDAVLSDENVAFIGEWIERTRVVCLTADPTERRIRTIIADHAQDP
jgi:hypothetical protein